MIKKTMFEFGSMSLWDRFFRSHRDDQPLGTLVSFPKSGRTWVRVMLDRLRVPLHYTHDGSDHKYATHFDALQCCGLESKGQPLVFLHRDPRDTAVSGFFQKSLRIENGYEGDLAQFIRDPHHGLEKILVFNLAWIDHCSSSANSNRTLSYEALRANTVDGLTALVTTYLPSRRVSRRRIRREVEHASFDRMQQQEKQGVFARRYDKALTPGDPDNQDSFKVRRGKIGGFTDYFSEQDLDFADQLLQRYNYSDRLAAAHLAALI